MTKAEAKRWNTWVNVMCIMTLIRRFYPKCAMCLITMGKVLQLRIDILCREYDVDEIVTDIDTFKEDSAMVGLFDSTMGKRQTISVEWKVDEDDN